MARNFFQANLRGHPIVDTIVYFLSSQINARHRIILGVTILIMIPVLLFTSRPSQTVRTDGYDKVPLAILSGNLDYVEETQVVWQVPPSPKAILFIAHGCHCRPAFFWDKSPNCPECTGLPEERVVVMHALAKGYAVLAISSTRECWSLGLDKSKVLNILSTWIKDRNLEKLPVVALGASSGGYFISSLAREYKFQAIIIMISEGTFKSMKIDNKYPSTLFVHMVKDKRRAALIQDAMEMLKSKGISTAELKCFPVRVTPEYFTRIPGLDSKTSQRMQQAFKESGMLDGDDFMVADGRSIPWMVPLKAKHVMPEQNYRLWDMHIQELLNLAYGYHEMTSMQANEMFEWLDKQLEST